MRVVIKRRDLLSQLFTTVHDARRHRYPNVGRRRHDRRHNISTLVVGHASRCAVPGIFIRLTTHDAKLLSSHKKINVSYYLCEVLWSSCLCVCLSVCLSVYLSVRSHIVVFAATWGNMRQKAAWPKSQVDIAWQICTWREKWPVIGLTSFKKLFLQLTFAHHWHT